ncbi:MAG TPA: HWE histidine kinase domain-containing protein [Pseudolabrys sp.]|nr:HWE histidine kinase domain-containing protein [Pseudolabrys sp.]
MPEPETTRLFEDADETVEAIHRGHVDAVVVIRDAQPQVIMLDGAHEPYRVLVERMSDGALTYGPDGSILYVNERLSELTGFAPEDLVNRDVMTLFDAGTAPLAPDESGEASLLRSGRDALPVKVWARPISVGHTTATLMILSDLSVQRRAEELAAAERFARSVLEQATEAILVLGRDGRITHASSIAEDLAEKPLVGLSISEALPLELRNAAEVDSLERFSGENLDRLLASKPFHGLEVRLRSERHSNRAFLLSAGPLLDATKARVGSIVTLTDITERKRAEEQQATIALELTHRVKNMLAVVQSLAAQTIRSSGSFRNFEIAFSGRLKALAVAHDILTETRWSGAELNELLVTVLAPFHTSGDDRIRCSGPQVLLGADAVVPLSMALHELATNAVKYGALAVSGGFIDLRWQIRDDQWVELDWKERGGAEVKDPSARGFGTSLIKRVLSNDLDATTEIIFEPDGLRCLVRFPIRVSRNPVSHAEA